MDLNGTIRPYAANDKDKIIELFRFNTPDCFDPSEEKDFIHYLKYFSDNYFVVEEGDEILGSGGFNYKESPKIAFISWDIVQPKAQGKGVGTKLTSFRIDKIKENPEVETIAVRTSQLAFRFYEKFGFKTKECVKDYWAKGFDLYLMELNLIIAK